MRFVNRRYFLLWHNHGGRLYAQNNWRGTMWVPHHSEKIHCIGAKIKPNIPWIIIEVLLMVKVEMSPLLTINRMSDRSIRLSLDMSKQEPSIPRIGEHTLQSVNHR
jgi:hypothetical protein